MQGAVGGREALQSVLASGEQVCAGQWEERGQQVRDSVSHCHCQELAWPEPCPLSARNHCELLSFWVGSCRSPRNQVSGAVFVSLKFICLVCPASHFLTPCTFPGLTPHPHPTFFEMRLFHGLPWQPTLLREAQRLRTWPGAPCILCSLCLNAALFSSWMKF